MKLFIPALLLVLLLIPFLSLGLEISSVHPNPAIVGSPVTIIGGPFAPSLKVVLGGREIIPSLVDERQLIFIIPQLGPGEHALYLLGDQQKSEQTISLSIALPPPQISSLEPSNIDECSTQEQRLITIRGDHFVADSQLSLSGQIVASTQVSATEISFIAPPLRAGTHGVQVTNPDGSKSLPHSLWFNNIPHIFDVSRGEDFVSSYQLIIKGENFILNSALIVYESSVGQPNLPPSQHIIPEQGGRSFIGEGARHPQTEAVTYVDCNTLIYNRYPYSGQDKTITLRVSNPDGKQTEPYELSTP